MNVLLEHTKINYAIYFSLKGSKEQEREEMILEGEGDHVLIGSVFKDTWDFFFLLRVLKERKNRHRVLIEQTWNVKMGIWGLGFGVTI